MAPASGKDYELIVYKNGSATGLSIDIPNGSTSGNNTGTTVSVSAGDVVSVFLTHVAGAAPANGQVAWSFEIQ